MVSLFSIILLIVVGLMLYRIWKKDYPVVSPSDLSIGPEEIEVPESHKIEVEEQEEKQDENTVHLV